MGDQKAEELSNAYRDCRQKRDGLIRKASFMSPASLLQRQFEKLARTDMQASMAYEQHVRDFHASLRNWYYPKMFRDTPFDVETVKRELLEYSTE